MEIKQFEDLINDMEKLKEQGTSATAIIDLHNGMQIIVSTENVTNLIDSIKRNEQKSYSHITLVEDMQEIREIKTIA